MVIISILIFALCLHVIVVTQVVDFIKNYLL
jgi:hypothetical protein